MENVRVLDHPLIKHKLTILRNKNTGTNEFRKLVGEIAILAGYEATKNLSLEEIEIETPMEKTTGYQLSGKKLCFVPILRAGLGMVDAFLTIVPSARVGHVGLYRDPETHKPVEYYFKMPADVKDREIFVLDPMLATGGSLTDAVSLLKERGAEHIQAVCIIGAPEGIEVFKKAHPDVDLYIAAIDRQLNDHGYILPGLGDAGDRLFGTK